MYLNFMKKYIILFQAMDGEKSAENRSSSKDAGKQAELAFKLYDKVRLMIDNFWQYMI